MPISIDDLNTLKVAAIKDHLKRLDLPTQGFKKELVDRLKEGMEAKGITELATEGDDEDESKKAAAVEQEEGESVVAVVDAEEKEDNPEVEAVDVEKVVEEPVSSGAAPAVTETEAVVLDTVPAEVAPEPELSLEEIKTRVLEHINTSISRAEKFNDLEKLKRLAKDKQRIEKFGISEENPIAIELGLIKPKETKKPQRQNNQGNKKKFNNKRRGNKRRYHPYNKN